MDVFGKRLSELIEERGVSQAQLADMTDTTGATINRYVKRLRTPNVDIVVNIAKAMNVSTDYLLGLSESKLSKIIDPEDEILISAFKKASARDVEIIWKLLDPYISKKDKIKLECESEKRNSIKAV